MWRSARDSGVFISAMKLSRSRRSASSIGLVTDIATASTHFSGAGKFFDVAPTVLRANCRKASACGSFTFRSRTRLSGSLSATTLSASANAAATRVAVDHVVEQRRALELAPPAPWRRRRSC